MIKKIILGTLLLYGTMTVLAQTFDGYVIYNPQNTNTAYLIDKDENIAHSWSCSDPCNYAVKLKENGNILRGVTYSSNILNGAAIGGLIQELDPSANVVWEYVYSNSDHCSHHDFCPLPNGNVILVAWEVRSAAELMQAGRDGATSDLWPTHFVELQPDGLGSANIIWEWHIWDHLIQDFDPTKDNYGVVADHPELMDINAVSAGGGPGGGGPGGGGGDWFHVNGINYNETLDQLVFSSRTASEIYIIDHSTTTTQASSHAGGNSGMGGDIIYRWGNPSNYNTTGTQTIPAAVHDPRWVEDGRPYGGYIQFFNNEGVSWNTSAVDLILAPESGSNYSFTVGNPYAPTSYADRHVTLTNSTGQSASDRMSNGNIFVAVSGEYMYEVDSNGTVVWSYNAGPTKAFRYECDHPGLANLLGPNPCGTPSSLDDFSNKNLSVYPNPSTGTFNFSGMELSKKVFVQVHNSYGKLVFTGLDISAVNLDSEPAGLYFITITVDEGKMLHQKLTIAK